MASKNITTLNKSLSQINNNKLTSLNASNNNTVALSSLINISYMLSQLAQSTLVNNVDLEKLANITETSDSVIEETIQKNDSIKIIPNQPCILPPRKPKWDDINTLGKLTFEKHTINAYVSYVYNLKNVMPNPLYNDFIHPEYDGGEYATADIYGDKNTAYLRYNKDNISNNISKDLYIPSIGELGIAMQNIQIINDSIDSLGSDYKDCKIPYDSIIPSSSLYYTNNIINNDYQITHNINNVWCFDNSTAEISYKPINNQFISLPFYIYKNNVVIDLDENIDNVNMNNIITPNIITNSQYNIEKILLYNETNPPIHNFRLDLSSYSDLNIENWFEYPFSSKYIYKILFPEVSDYLYYENNFAKLHNQYLTYYAYYCEYGDAFTSIPKDKIKTTYTAYYAHISGIHNNFASNNGVTYPSYIKNVENHYVLCQNTNNFWQQYLIYNTPIYGNHLILLPLRGSSENNYKAKTNKVMCELHVAVPSECTNFNCIVGNGYDDTNVNIYEWNNIKGFSIYEIIITFKSYYASENIITFMCNYHGKEYKKQYFYSVHSFNISNLLSTHYSYTTRISLDNYYVSRDPYYWWEIDNWNSLRPNWSYYKSPTYESNVYSYYYGDGFGKLFDNSYIIKKSPEKTDIVYVNDKFYNTFIYNNSVNFNLNYNLSYLTDSLDEKINQMNFNGTVSTRGLRVDRILDSDVISGCTYTRNFGMENYYSYFKYIDDITHTLTNNYHLLTMNIYIPTGCRNNIHKFNPILRIQRSVDEYGLYNELIFAYLTKNINTTTQNNITTIIKTNDYASIMFRGENNNLDSIVNLNLPVVGAKQHLCLAFDLMDKNINYNDYYLFSDYLFLFNNTNNVITLMITDPSLSLSAKMNNIIQIDPKELKLYYPNNFNYNNTSNNNSKCIYQITLTDYNNRNIIFYNYNLGRKNNNDISSFKNSDGYHEIAELLYKYTYYTTWNIYVPSYDTKLYYHNAPDNNNANIAYYSTYIDSFQGQSKDKLLINIQNYSENKTGHLVVLESSVK